MVACLLSGLLVATLPSGSANAEAVAGSVASDAQAWLPANMLVIILLGMTSAIALMRLAAMQLRLQREVQAHQALERHFRALMALDGLTGLPNRHSFLDQAAAALAASVAQRQPLCLLRIDIDQFHQINDRYGQLAGDDQLTSLARSLYEQLEGAGLAARMGGDEFAMLLPGTSLPAAEALAERVRAEAAGTPAVAETGITISIGIASAQANGKLDLLLAQAGRALADAKRAGGNQVAVARLPDEAAYPLHR
ncbi:diguanylate cyclase (GGDEF) domain-containing protein [Azospirillum sp. RU38E]|nr:diguanylate cyclase (GGDEF) domain-containing protein [Azospirillum sp. RU38E]SNR99160.1 diguanylate cyclase (GGDEF) domain-containing protein [Azospirillum sp. RU37A]